MEFQNFTLDKFQEQAIEAVEKNNSVLVSSPTGSGKTLIADYIIDKALKKDKRVIYTAPIKALSNQKFRDFISQYGEDKIGLITGDIVINPSAKILIMTTEVYRNMAIIEDEVLDDVSYCIMDEIHFISDEERGYIWEESIIFSPEHVRFLFLSATIPNSEEFAKWVSSIKHHKVDIVKHHVRPVPLERMFYDIELGITTLDKIKEAKDLDKYPRDLGRGRYKRIRVPPPDFRNVVLDLKNMGKLPCIYFVFSRVRTQEYAVSLTKKQGFLTDEEKKNIIKMAEDEFIKLSKEVKSLKSTMELRQCIPKGVAFHNAGMLPDVKHIVEKLFGAGLIKVLFATETFAVGINMPAKTVCFDSLRKYTGTGFRYINSKEYFQISGRAGRRGIDKKGLSVAVIHRPSADLKRIEEFTKEDKLPLKSQFRITPNTVLNMVNLHPEEEVKKMLTMNLFTFQKTKGDLTNRRMLGSVKARFTKLLNALTKLGYIHDGELTDLGIFASKIFSYEMEVSQFFAGDMDYKIDEYSILLFIFALVYEGRRETRFYNLNYTRKAKDLFMMLRNHKVLRVGTWHKNIEKMTAIVEPLYEQETFMDIMKNTSMPEGDMMRLFMQVIDKLDQIDKAIIEDYEMTSKVRNCKHLLKDCLRGIHIF